MTLSSISIDLTLTHTPNLVILKRYLLKTASRTDLWRLWVYSSAGIYSSYWILYMMNIIILLIY